METVPNSSPVFLISSSVLGLGILVRIWSGQTRASKDKNIWRAESEEAAAWDISQEEDWGKQWDITWGRGWRGFLKCKEELQVWLKELRGPWTGTKLGWGLVGKPGRLLSSLLWRNGTPS